MSDPFVGEIRAFGFGFAPRDWAPCDGQLVAIAENQALYAILGTTFGGDGHTNFRLPDLRTRVPVHPGADVDVGQSGGEAGHVLSTGEMPRHEHALQGVTSAGTIPNPADNYLAASEDLYADPVKLVPLAQETVSDAGTSQPHNNMQPYLTVNFCIALQGVFPSRD